MKARPSQYFMILILTAASVAYAAPKAKAKSKVAAPALGAKLETNHEFDELSVRGRYQGAAEGIATVEDEKQLSNLIDYRSDFKDRLTKSVGQK